MKNKSPIIKVNILVCFLVILLLTACGSGKPVQNVREDESTAVDVPADPPTESESQPPSDEVVWMEDMVYPGAEFLLEVDGIGGPIVHGDSIRYPMPAGKSWLNITNSSSTGLMLNVMKSLMESDT